LSHGQVPSQTQALSVWIEHTPARHSATPHWLASGCGHWLADVHALQTPLRQILPLPQGVSSGAFG